MFFVLCLPEKIMHKSSELLTRVPHGPGIYKFINRSGVILYVGKAVDLAKRVRQYFVTDDALNPKIKALISQIRSVETTQTVSEFDALLLEAKLIHDYAPKYNSIAKDDKSSLYILLTLSESLPHVRLVRKHSVSAVGSKDVLFGPFQSGRVARTLLKSLRRVVSYCTQKERNGIPCFHFHLGLCTPCPSVINKMTDENEKLSKTRMYRRNIFRLRDILSGKSSSVLHAMSKRMDQLAGKEEFEEAITVRNQYSALTNLLKRHYDPSLYFSYAESTQQELMRLATMLSVYYPSIKKPVRIECIDISNIGDQYATGSLVVLADGMPDTSLYRRFKIRTVTRQNDPAMIAEVLKRRLRHTEWPYPDLMIVDGGKTQLKKARQVLAELRLMIPVIGLAKRQEVVIIPLDTGYRTLHLSYTNPALHVIQRIRDEAHRFALSYHRKLRSDALVA